MKFYHGNETYHFDDLSHGHIRSTNQANFAFLQIANFGHFDTFPVGCVVGWLARWGENQD